MQGGEIPYSGKVGSDSWIGLDWIGLDWIGLDWIGREIADGGLKIRRGIDQAGYSLRSIDKR